MRAAAAATKGKKIIRHKMKEDVKMAELSPMMKQYLRIKSENEDSILFFRVGDFYEMFFDDAKTSLI